MILVVLLVLARGGGGWGFSRYGFAGLLPSVLILLVLAILYFIGYLQTR